MKNIKYLSLTKNNYLNTKIGILGGGQLGRMLQIEALKLGINIFFLDPDKNCPCSVFSNFITKGSFKDDKNVYDFGINKNVLSIEIEHINTDSLRLLENKGVRILPSIDTINTIKNKAKQKVFFKENNIPTADFIINNEKNINVENLTFPIIQKSQLDGYDGKGVVLLNDKNDISKQLNCSSILEKVIPIKKELAITYAFDKNKNVRLFPIADMVFDNNLNLVEYINVPAELNNNIENEIFVLTKKIANYLNSEGIFTIEMFLDIEDNIFVNEIAPRAHNSAHYSIEACNISQYRAQLMILLGMEVPEIKLLKNASMLNIVGDTEEGIPFFENMEEILNIENSFLHLYDKKTTKKGRKMGHLTLLSSDNKLLKEKTLKIKSLIKVNIDNNE